MKRTALAAIFLSAGLLQAQPQPRPGGGEGFGRQMDANGDGKISREEFPGPKEMFDQFDKDKDNFLSQKEREAMRQNRGRGGFGRGGFGGGFRRPGQNPAGGNLAQDLFKSVDANKDSTLSAKEWQAYFGKILAEADADKNGNLSAEEWQAWRQRQSRSSGRPDRGLKVGVMAPKVSAEFMTQKGSLNFSKIKHLSVVIFGSYT